MKHEDLIRKLESLETPEIELPGHRKALRMALLSSGRFKQRTIMAWAKILAPVTAAVLLISIVGFFNVIQPRMQIAQAKEIAMNDPQVRVLMEEYGLEITEVKLQNGEAFVFVANQLASAQSRPDENVLPVTGEGFPPAYNITVSGYILKVDLVEKKAIEFGKLDEITTLQDIKLEDIDFVKFEPLEGTAPKEADLE